MTVLDLVKAIDGEILSGAEKAESTAVTGCYVCDLLSIAMSKVTAGAAWITVQTNVNIVAVSSLTEASCVVVAEGMHVEGDIIEKAAEEDIIIVRTGKSAYEAAVETGKML